MNDDNYSNYDLYDGDCTGQSPDDDQSLVVPRRGLEPDTGPDDDPMTVQRRGSPSDTDSFVSEEDMDEYRTEYSDDGMSWIRSFCRIQPGQSSVRKNVKRNIKRSPRRNPVLHLRAWIF